MKTFFCNFIADMQGPFFLFFYFFYATVFLIIAYIISMTIKNSIKSNKSTHDKFDEYDIALLRNGVRDVAGLAIFNLTRKKFLIKDSKEKLYRNKNHGSIDKLNQEEKLLLGEFEYDISRDIGGILNLKNFWHNLENLLKTRKERLEQVGFLSPESIKHKLNTLKFFIVVAILGLGIYKMGLAISREYYNIGFLFILTSFATILVFLIIQNQRLTKHGKKYLVELQLIYADKKNINLNKEAAYYRDENAGLYLGIFGLSILNGANEYNYLASEYKRSTYTSGGCGGGCSSCSSGVSCGSSCGSGGCGGGCGGCGGCG